MALFRRQAVDFKFYDDQSPYMWGSFEGNWTRRQYEGANNNTLTSTSTPGASISFTFSGTRAWLCGGILNITNGNGTYISYPTADYKIDGVSAGLQLPVVDLTKGKVIYFQTTELPDRIHTIDITVTTANDTHPFIFDYFGIVPSATGGQSSVSTLTSTPSPTSTSSSLPVMASRSAPVGAIVGGVVGGIACIVVLVLAVLWYILRQRSRGGQIYYFEKPTPADLLACEALLARIDPFNITTTTLAPSSDDFSGPDPQPAYPGSPLGLSFRQAVTNQDSSQYNQSGPSETILTYVTGNSAQPKVGKAALIALQNQDVRRPPQHRDSGIRFNENGEQEAGPSQSPSGIPPTYTPD